MGPTGSLVNVIQVHPTRRCNLRCQHCYSTSGPEQSGELAIESLEGVLRGAAGEGFNAMGVSGGEPFTYSELPRLLAAARGLGLFTSVTTNGLLLTPKHLEPLLANLSLLAISVDGIPASHDRLRARTGAFAQLQRSLPYLRQTAVPFGFIFTLTMANLDELDWVATFAAAEGASLLQIHPLEQVGRAREYQLEPPDDRELAFAFLEVARLQARLGDRLTLQLDVADRSLIEREPDRAFAVPPPAAPPGADTPLASLVSPLVVEDDGWIVPIQHGFATEHAIGHIDEAPFAELAARWKRERHARFSSLARRVWGDLRTAPPHLPFTNWYAAVTTRSQVEARPIEPGADPPPVASARLRRTLPRPESDPGLTAAPTKL